MAINWSHLPPEVWEKVCFCLGRDKQDGFGLDQESGYWVHRVQNKNKAPCNKPSVATSVIECDECGKPFVPAKYKTVQLSFLGAMCPKCEEEL